VADQKPPRLQGDERSTLLALLDYQRESVISKLDGLGPEQLAWSPVRSGTNLIWLVTHLTAAETTWLAARFAGDPPNSTINDSAVSADQAIADYREVAKRSNGIVISASSLDEPCRSDVVLPPVTLRWVVSHLLEETARHAGHADILRELIDGQTGR